MRRRGEICGALLIAVAALSALLPGAASARAPHSMVVQPDGKILLTGEIWPEAAAIARLNADGTPDPSFGEGGFEIDRRLPGIRALALEPDGRILGAAVGGYQLARYLPDGTPDPSFAGGGVGGSDEADQPHFRYSDYGPAAVVLRPGGGIVVGGIHEVNGAGATDGPVTGYTANGFPLEPVGQIPLPNGGASGSGLTDLLQAPDGSLIGAGWVYPGAYPDVPPVHPVLARFLPGSGTQFDPGFGGGAGLVAPDFPTKPQLQNQINALAASGEKLLVAGRAAGTLLLARFNWDGTLDTGFGENGFAAPPISGPGEAASKGALEEANTWADSLAVTADGGIVVAGGTTQFGEWTFTRDIGAHCVHGCPQPMLARFDASGHLDPGFGSGGLLRLAKPDGSPFEGEVEEVVPLPDGRILVKGRSLSPGATTYRPFLARLNRDGSYDPSFGEGGLTMPRFPCTDQPPAQLRRAGCIASMKLKLKLSNLAKPFPALHLWLRPTLSWAAVHSVTLALPQKLQLTPGFKSKLRIVAGSKGRGTVHVGHRDGGRQTVLLFEGFGNPRRLRVEMRRGALRLLGKRSSHRRLRFEVGAQFSDARWGSYAGQQTVKRRAG